MGLIGFEGDPASTSRSWPASGEFPGSIRVRHRRGRGRERDGRDRRAEAPGGLHGTDDRHDRRRDRADFDDAIEAEELPNGGFRIGIHIADVSHYVSIGSGLDAEAFERGTSVYFPDRAIAMLPERLSNDLCSLRPNEERRTLSAVLTLDRKGETVKSEFFRSLIKSRARLTYSAVGDSWKVKRGRSNRE